MKIVAFSDSHGYLPDIEPCDLLIIGGDFCPIIDHSLSYQQRWLATIFGPWLERVPARHIIGIAGNHDVIFNHGHECGYPVPMLPWTYLQDRQVEYEGLLIYGTPYQKQFNNWPFMRTEWELDRLWYDMPYSDILISHGPPKGVLDYYKGENLGSSVLRQKIVELSIPLTICGHIHENNGVEQIGKLSYVYNVAVCDNKSDLTYIPTVISLGD